jgi:hypothetical protein
MSADEPVDAEFVEATPVKPSLVVKFWSCVEKTDACWLWCGTLSNGYGQCIDPWTAKASSAARVAWRLSGRTIITGPMLRKLCRVSRCVRPEHHTYEHCEAYPLRPLVDRLLDRMERKGDCWEWTGALTDGGYGAIETVGGTKRVHRVMWECVFGEIRDGLLVLHECDNRRCFNPEHLFLGTHEDNMADMVRKGRQARGECCGAARHPEAVIVEFLRCIARGESVGVTADRFGISRSHAASIARGEFWKHVHGVVMT